MPTASDTVLEKKEGMVVKLVPILHSSAVDFGGHAARIHKRAGIDGQPVAPLTDFERSFTRRCPLTPLGVNAEFVFDTRRPSLSAPVTVVVTPLECQSKPRTQPSAWNQNESDKRRSSSSGPRSATTCVAISRARRVIRVNSHAGARPECDGRLAKPGRVAIATRLASAGRTVRDANRP